MRCRFTDKPSLVDFRQAMPSEACDDLTGLACPECDPTKLTLAFDFDTNGPELDFGFGAASSLLLTLTSTLTLTPTLTL